ncbi:MAG: UDP-N-acetylmuramate dehydrogenase [Myxococcota bacterium]|nr:UDP-N-acetylmuramate dehydrogenase [Myxococcota bacterium]
MLRIFDEPFANHTTLKLGGPAREWWRLESTAEIGRAVALAEADGVPFVIVGGGSNLVASDRGFPGRVLQVANRGVTISGDEVTVAAGEPWDALVGLCVDEGLAGLECLSGIPGTAGATPIQNVGAYGQEVSDTIVAVEAYDRRVGHNVTLSPKECAFAYRDSAIKHDARWVVIGVTFALRRSRTASGLRYPELTKALGSGEEAPLAEVRSTVVGLRRAKGMVIDPTDPESCSAGSFFMNPILGGDALADLEQRLATQPPRYAHGDRWKVPAAWLIERSGFTKGHGGPRVGISKKHALALVHYGGGTTDELLALARSIRDGVLAQTGVTLHNEPVLLGETL